MKTHEPTLEELREKALAIIAKDPESLNSLRPIDREVIMKLTGLDTPTPEGRRTPLAHNQK
jgi:hypothetical protein